MQIAITGGSGLLGRAVVEFVLSQGHSAVSIDRVAPAQPDNRPGLTFAQLDLTNYEKVEEALAGCEALIHLAAIPSPGRHSDHVIHNNNVSSSYNALLAAATLGIKKVCQASSCNAIGLNYSRRPNFDYFPVNEKHPTYNEDPYALSKWVCEIQGDSFARRHEDMTISSLRFSWIPAGPPQLADAQAQGKYRFQDLWGYTNLEAAARCCLLAAIADFKGHEVFYITASRTTTNIPSIELAREFFPEVPVRPGLEGTRSFFDCSKAERLLGWKHNLNQPD